MKLASILMTVIIMVGMCMGVPLTVSAFSDGDGSLDNPYIITTAEELDAVRNNLQASYKLGNDIDLTKYLVDGGTGFVKWGNAGWEPIGSYRHPFAGSFDGNDYKISGLWINRDDTDFVGLFGIINTYDVITNVGVEIDDTGVNGNNTVGGLVGALEGTIENCYAVGSVSGRQQVGGLIGSQDVTSYIKNCYATGNVTATGGTYMDFVGGLVGYQTGTVENCYATGNVTAAGGYAGGLVGAQISMGEIYNCYATGSVAAVGNCAGGLVGFHTDGSISNCYAKGAVSGNNYVGGLVGWQAGLSKIKNCHATGNVAAVGNYAGGLVGAQISDHYFQNFNDIINCFVAGNITGAGDHIGAISGYIDNESSIADSYRYEFVTVNGNVIAKDNENSAPDKIHGGVITASAPNMQAVKENDILTVTTANIDETGILFVAAYDDDRLVEVSSVQEVTPENMEYIFDISTVSDLSILKIFLWKDFGTMRPLCPSVEISECE